MLDFIIQNFNNKCCKKNQPKQLCSKQNATVPAETGAVVEIDYDKMKDVFTEAIVNASKIIEKNKEIEEHKKIEEAYDNFDKSLGILGRKNKIAWKKILFFILNLISVPFHFLFYVPRKGTNNIATYKCFAIINECSFMLYSFICLLASMFFIHSSIHHKTSATVQELGLTSTICFGILFFVIYGMIDIARCETHMMHEDANIIPIFSSIMVINGMILTIVLSDINRTIKLISIILSWAKNSQLFTTIFFIIICVKIFTLFLSRKETGSNETNEKQ